MESTPELPEVQQLIREHVAENLRRIRSEGPASDAGRAALEYACSVTLDALLQCGISQAIAEARCREIGANILQWELFNAWLVEY